MTNAEFVAGLREMAAFYETHPEAPVPNHGILYVFAGTREGFLSDALALAKDGRIEKRADPIDSGWPQYHAIRHFGECSVDIQIARSLVCRKIRDAEYECPDSLLEEARDFTEVQA